MAASHSPHQIIQNIFPSGWPPDILKQLNWSQVCGC
ncbi:phage virulence factor PagK family protein [Salmonella enterica]|nr:phage virulence factor PagK family protein [Salmonella enterica]